VRCVENLAAARILHRGGDLKAHFRYSGELLDQSLRLTEITHELKTEASNATHFVVIVMTEKELEEFVADLLRAQLSELQARLLAPN
jgi:hypothetical protein